MGTYGLTTTTATPKPALTTVTRWNDGVRRHTLYTVGEDNWGFYIPALTPADQATRLSRFRAILGNQNWVFPAPDSVLPAALCSPDVTVGRSVSTTTFTWVPVSYPASTPVIPPSLLSTWSLGTISPAQSIALGVSALTALITATPGTFALAGTGQGAVVISQVLKALLPGGALSARSGDCIGATAFGNPLRAPGVGFPGGTDPGGAGILSSAITGQPLLSGLAGLTLPSWWMELTIPGDFFAAAPMSTMAAPALQQAAQGVFLHPGGVDVPTLISNALPALTGVGQLGNMVSRGLSQLSPAAVAAAVSWVSGRPALDPHYLYGVSSPTTLPTGSALSASATYTDVAVEYLNGRGAAVTPR